MIRACKVGGHKPCPLADQGSGSWPGWQLVPPPFGMHEPVRIAAFRRRLPAKYTSTPHAHLVSNRLSPPSRSGGRLPSRRRASSEWLRRGASGGGLCVVCSAESPARRCTLPPHCLYRGSCGTRMGCAARRPSALRLAVGERRWPACEPRDGFAALHQPPNTTGRPCRYAPPAPPQTPALHPPPPRLPHAPHPTPVGVRRARAARARGLGTRTSTLWSPNGCGRSTRRLRAERCTAQVDESMDGGWARGSPSFAKMLWCVGQTCRANSARATPTACSAILGTWAVWPIVELGSICVRQHVGQIGSMIITFGAVLTEVSGYVARIRPKVGPQFVIHREEVTQVRPACCPGLAQFSPSSPHVCSMSGDL